MATFLIGCSVAIGTISLNRAYEIKVFSSWKMLADTAMLKLPLLQGKVDPDNPQVSLADKIKPGDPVEIQMSYIGTEKEYQFNEFTGFVKKVSPKVPLVVECEDAAYLLRKVNLVKSFRATTLKEIIEYIVGEVNANNNSSITISSSVPNVKFSKFRLDNINGAQALEKIKKEYGLVAYFRNMELYVGLAYADLVGNVKYNLSSNIIRPNLKWENGEDKLIKLKAVSILKNNTKLEKVVGDQNGEQRTKFYYNIDDLPSLESFAEADIKEFKVNKFQGNIRTFLVPYVQHSMTAVIEDPEYENRSGNYMVDSIQTTYRKGIRRKVEFGILL